VFHPSCFILLAEDDSELTSFLGYMVFYLVPVIGAVAVYLAMPGERRTARFGAVVLGAVALGAVVVVLAAQIGYSYLMFYILAVLALVAAVRVVTHQKPVYSAVWFLLLVVCVAGIALVAGAEFLAAALVIIYAGAILVTYLFVIMLAQQPTPPEYDTQSREPAFAVLAGFVLVAGLAGPIVYKHGPEATAPPTRTVQRGRPDAAVGKPPVIASVEETWREGNVLTIGRELMTVHVVAFEAAGVLLLVGIVGGIALATRRLGAASGCGWGGGA
jgi:NADH-quinone oxidoreductase subunit J